MRTAAFLVPPCWCRHYVNSDRDRNNDRTSEGRERLKDANKRWDRVPIRFQTDIFKKTKCITYLQNLHYARIAFRLTEKLANGIRIDLHFVDRPRISGGTKRDVRSNEMTRKPAVRKRTAARLKCWQSRSKCNEPVHYVVDISLQAKFSNRL